MNVLTPAPKPEPKGMSEQAIFKSVLTHCLFIILSPIISFFVAKLYIFDALFHLEALYSSLYSAFIAVIVLHVALGNFIYRAYFNTEAIPGFDKLEKED